MSSAVTAACAWLRLMAHFAAAIAARYSSCLSAVGLAGGREIDCLSVGSASWQRPLEARSIERSTLEPADVEGPATTALFGSTCAWQTSAKLMVTSKLTAAWKGVRIGE